MYLQSGTLLQGGKYRIEKTLGKGGFGITYLAFQVYLERKVAVKEFFMSEYCDREATSCFVSLGSKGAQATVERYREKFIKEARNLAKLSHHNIIHVIDVFEENGTAYYVMEYVEGGSLADKVKDEGYLSEPLARRIIKQLASALEYVHQQHITHLDVKPSNVLINNKNEITLIDFGLSKQYDSVGNQTSSNPIGLTEGYAPMEQYAKKGVNEFSPETDVYALGATFFHLLTGKVPPSAYIVNEDGLPLNDLQAKGVSPSAISAICKAMVSKKKDRIKTVRSFVDILEQADINSESTLYLDESTLSTDESTKWKTSPKAPVDKQNPVSQTQPSGQSTMRNILLGLIGAFSVAIVVLLVLLLMNGKDKTEAVEVPQETPTVVDEQDSRSEIASDETPSEQTTTTVAQSENTEVRKTETQQDDAYEVEINEQEEPVYEEPVPESTVKLRRIKTNIFVRTGPGTNYEPMYSPYNDFDSNHTNGVVTYTGTTVEVLSDVVNGFVKVRQTDANNDRDNWGEGWVSARMLE